MSLPPIDQQYFTDFLVQLLNIASPTGFASPAIDFVEKEFFPVQADAAPVALAAHVDTLGAVVKEIKPNGRLKLSKVGGIQWPSVETEGVWVFTSKGEKFRGSLLIDNASGHVFGPAGGDVALALIGPGIDASHNYERTHMDALNATTN